MKVAWRPSDRICPGSRQSTISRSSAFLTPAARGDDAGNATATTTNAAVQKTENRDITGQAADTDISRSPWKAMRPAPRPLAAARQPLYSVRDLYRISGEKRWG